MIRQNYLTSRMTASKPRASGDDPYDESFEAIVHG